MLNSPGASGEIVPLGQEPAHKDRKWNSSTWYRSTAGPCGRETFQRDGRDGLTDIHKTCLPRHIQTVRSTLLCIQWRQTRQSVAEAVRQIKPRIRKKEKKWNSVKVWRGVGGFGVITHCWVLSNDINPFICSSQAAAEQFSLQWQPGSFSFLLSLFFDAVPVHQTNSPASFHQASSVP